MFFLVYFFTYILWIYVLDFVKYFKQRVGQTSFSFSMSDHIVFWVSKVVHIFLFIVLPLFFHSILEVLAGYAIATMTCGFVIAVVFQMAHVVEKAHVVSISPEHFAQKGENTLVYDQENALHQLETTVDFAPNNKWISWYVGGLNFQVEHHLFPNWSHVHYPKIRLIVKRVASEFGYEHKEYPNFREAILSHFRLLKEMGKKPTPQAMEML